MSRDNNHTFQTIQANKKMVDLELTRKFRMFFTGLVFAVISFIGAHPDYYLTVRL